jgi:hypothetical protein
MAEKPSFLALQACIRARSVAWCGSIDTSIRD